MIRWIIVATLLTMLDRSAAVRASLALAACLTATTAAHAQVDPTAAARDLFNEGLALADAEQWEEAAERFERAYELRSSAPIAVNWAHALERTGRWVAASELLARVQLDETADAETRALAGERFEALRPRIPRVTIRLAGATAGVDVTLDGEPVDAALLDVPIPIDPGEHELVAARGEERIARRSFTVGEHDEHEEIVTVAALDVAGPPVASEEIYETWWFWTIVGVIVAGGVAASVGLVIALDGQMPAPIEGNGMPPVIRVGP